MALGCQEQKYQSYPPDRFFQARSRRRGASAENQTAFARRSRRSCTGPITGGLACLKASEQPKRSARKWPRSVRGESRTTARYKKSSTTSCRRRWQKLPGTTRKNAINLKPCAISDKNLPVQTAECRFVFMSPPNIQSAMISSSDSPDMLSVGSDSNRFFISASSVW